MAQTGRAIKTFEVETETTANSWYKITVKFNGVVVDEFLEPTAEGASWKFCNAGYRSVGWPEGGRIVY